jgi:transcriptional regulator with XRE-family HTH domain
VADLLATRIRSARKDADLSREALAAQLGVSLATVVRYETGRTKRISANTLISVAKATRKPLSYFLAEEAA